MYDYMELFPTLISLVAVTTLPTPGLVSTAKGRHVSWYLVMMDAHVAHV